MTTSPVEWKTCRNGHTGYMVRHHSKPNSLACTVCLKKRDGMKYENKRTALIEIYSQLLDTTKLMKVTPGGAHLAKAAVMNRLRKHIENLGGVVTDASFGMHKQTEAL